MSTQADPSIKPDSDAATVTRQQWKWSALAGMASYLDAGSIVALGAGLALFQSQLNLSSGAVGALAAIGPNAIGCALGAFAGGWLGDKLGRKRIYQYDLLVYAAGILCIALAVNAAMLFIGTFVVGVAVGADVPTSLALVGELAPAKARGKLLGFTQVAWCLGPTIVLWLAVLLAPLGLLGIRIIFLHLLVVALVTWALRRGLAESARWVAATTAARQNVRALFSGAN
ncbi:MAG TPA: MFS transporter, partial [Verrucomicrobiae bacterium]|nr:MFS transporter [Verrucomicrobiae bacterium]